MELDEFDSELRRSKSFVLPVMLSAVILVFSDWSPGNPRVLEEEDTEISSAVGASRKCGQKSAIVVQL